MNREKKIMETLKDMGIRTESELKMEIKKAAVNISIMVADHAEPERMVG